MLDSMPCKALQDGILKVLCQVVQFLVTKAVSNKEHRVTSRTTTIFIERVASFCHHGSCEPNPAFRFPLEEGDFPFLSRQSDNVITPKGQIAAIFPSQSADWDLESKVTLCDFRRQNLTDIARACRLGFREMHCEQLRGLRRAMCRQPLGYCRWINVVARNNGSQIINHDCAGAWNLGQGDQDMGANLGSGAGQPTIK